MTALGADATVVIGGGDDGQALKAEAQDGYDVVIDTVYGAPVVAAFDATAPGARVVTIGTGAGDATIPFRALQGRSHTGHGNQFASPEVQRDAYAKLTEHAVSGEIVVEIERFALGRAEQAGTPRPPGLTTSSSSSRESRPRRRPGRTGGTRGGLDGDDGTSALRRLLRATALAAAGVPSRS